MNRNYLELVSNYKRLDKIIIFMKAKKEKCIADRKQARMYIPNIHWDDTITHRRFMGRI